MTEEKSKVLYNNKSDVKNARDVVDLFCRFSENLEFSPAHPSEDTLKYRIQVLTEQVNDLMDATLLEKNKVNAVNAAADVAFVAITQLYCIFRVEGFDAVRAQVKTRQALDEVGKTNLTKEIPTESQKRIKKPEGWEKPNMEDLFLTPEEVMFRLKTRGNNA